MAQTSIILIAGLFFLIRYEPSELDTEVNRSAIVLWVCLITLIPILLAYLTRRWANLRITIVFEVLSLIGLVCTLYLLHLPDFVNKQFAFLEPVHHSREILPFIPFFVSLLGIRFVMYDGLHFTKHFPTHTRYGIRFVMHGLRKSLEQSWEYLGFNFRMLLLPLFPLLFVNAVQDFTHLFPEQIGAYVGLALLLPLIMLPFVFAPLLMQFLWKTEPLTDTVLKQKLQLLTDRSGMKYRDIGVWQTGSLSIANAAVAGIIPRNRKVFITDTLLHNFPDEQIETIVAHEIGHIRHKHLLVSTLLVLGYLLSSVIFYRLVMEPLNESLAGFPILLSIISILFFVLYFKVLYNFLSRRFEHQADLYAVDLTDNQEAFKSALENLSSFSSLPKPIRFILELFETHPSLERRLSFLNRTDKGEKSVHRYRKCLLEVQVLIVSIPVLIFLIYLMFR
ncbi:M48 family metalloprotease [Candidatus Poribacteria bacterium]|nr:M48 family metalloprotease [Candidatus Poribacteria bacterium]MYF55821.1 M48 family metalloprotease [Candidatus Poribacteria bacterium]